MKNTGLDEAQAGIKIARRNINNLSYADNNTLMAKSEEELKRDHGIWSHHFMANRWGNSGNSGCFPCYCSVQFSRSVVSDSLRPHGLQYARLPLLSPTPRVYANSCPLTGDAIQPSHPLSSPSPPAFNLSQHQGIFQWVSSSHQVAKVLELQLQYQSFQWIFRTDFL